MNKDDPRKKTSGSGDKNRREPTGRRSGVKDRRSDVKERRTKEDRRSKK